MKSFGLLDPFSCSKATRLQVLRPAPAEHKDLAAYHTQDYLQFVLEPAERTLGELDRADFGLEEVSEFGSRVTRFITRDSRLPQDCPPFAGLSEYVRLVAGGTLTGSCLSYHRKSWVKCIFDQLPLLSEKTGQTLRSAGMEAGIYFDYAHLGALVQLHTADIMHEREKLRDSAMSLTAYWRYSR